MVFDTKVAILILEDEWLRAHSLQSVATRKAPKVRIPLSPPERCSQTFVNLRISPKEPSSTLSH